MTTQSRTLRSDTPLAAKLTAALKQGDVETLGRLLAGDPKLARCSVEDPKGGRRMPLHIFADWPGHIPNAAPIVQALVAAGADVSAPAVGMFREAPLHWAASNDDVALIDRCSTPAPTSSRKSPRSMAGHPCRGRSATDSGRRRGGLSNAARKRASGMKPPSG
jgi:hypothetical protein